MLTQDQKKLLRMASSKMTPENYSSLEKEEREFYDKRVEAAIATIYAENPKAFLFTYEKGQKVDIKSLLIDRSFYHAPTGPTVYKSSVKHKVMFPDHLKISKGVK